MTPIAANAAPSDPAPVGSLDISEADKFWAGVSWRAVPSANILFPESNLPVTYSIITNGAVSVLIASQLCKVAADRIVALQDAMLAARGK